MSDDKNGLKKLKLSDPLWSPHLFGFFVLFSAFIMSNDVAVIEAGILRQLGLGWQASLLMGTPISCALGCPITFFLLPVGNQSRYALLRGIGRISTFGRYLAFSALVFAVTFLATHVLFSSVESLELPNEMSQEEWTRIEHDVGDGVTWSSTRLFFRKDKRAAVQRALEKEGIWKSKQGN